jgi:polyisoprenoid-binding protein YceI
MTVHPATLPSLVPATYRIDPERSTVRFTATHFFGLGAVHGTFAVQEGSIIVAGDLGATRVCAMLDAATIDTGNPRRDNDLRSAKFLDVARHPTITFTSRTVATDAMTGVLTVRGVGQRVTLAIRPDGEGRFHASTRLDRRAFGVTAARGLIAPLVDVEIEVVPSDA